MKADLLERMRRNPAGDWTLDDVKRLCSQHDVLCKSPSGGGSHYKLEDVASKEILIVPFRRAIRPEYIRKLVQFIDGVIASRK